MATSMPEETATPAGAAPRRAPRWRWRSPTPRRPLGVAQDRLADTRLSLLHPHRPASPRCRPGHHAAHARTARRTGRRAGGPRDRRRCRGAAPGSRRGRVAPALGLGRRPPRPLLRADGRRRSDAGRHRGPGAPRSCRRGSAPRREHASRGHRHRERPVAGHHSVGDDRASAAGEYEVRVDLRGYEGKDADRRPDRARAAGRASVALSRAAPTSGTADILSTPFGANVVVDGVAAGQTPLLQLKLKPGSRKVEIDKEGYEPWSRP